ncbi:Wzz/FepE/Etk N-terminal domain-containing protein [Pseudomonas monteilii]|uniref:Chain-length determining protein n=1 Tax=Pseudomonas monteilii TaxID=76759 RepID=A0A2N1IZ75_9PSED|nr:Wzz/FepE/Etk N-terminal domain-containing protein [Pseudomonas monteilii]PKI26038.1 chain-length determining protein [Pseudomonas monteilii]
MSTALVLALSSEAVSLNPAGISVTGIPTISPAPIRDEIDVVDILQALWKKKIQIGACACLAGVLAGGYAFLLTPEFQVSTVLRPAALNDLDSLNRSKVYKLTPSAALNKIGASLDSYETRLGYFRTNSELREAFVTPGRSDEQGFEYFNRNALKVIQPDSKKSNLLTAFIGLELRYPKGIDGQQVLNGLVQYAIQKERQSVAEDLNVIISNRVKEIDNELASAREEYEIGKMSEIAALQEGDNIKRAKLNDELRALRAQLKLRRADRIAQLDEAIAIARRLGLKRPSTPSSMGHSEAEGAGNVIRTEINNQQLPMYFLGTDALEAERQALRERKNDDFVEPRIAQIRKELMLLEQNRTMQALEQRQKDELFVKGGGALRAERSRLNAVNLDLSGLRLVSVDQQATEPLSPIFPRKSLFVSLGALLGGLIGVVYVLLRQALKARQRDELRETMMMKKVIGAEVITPLPSRPQ